MIKGNILKLSNELIDGKAHYKFPIGSELISMNELIGKKISLKFTGQINDIVTGEKIKKSYNSGYSYKSFISLAQCDMCIVKPELCHYDKGTCREPQWGEKHCLQPHVIYFAISSHLKVGITRQVNVPHRWIDQGASLALPILKVKNRLTAGLIEKEISKEFSDKTNWRKMLKSQREHSVEDLEYARDLVVNSYGEFLDDLDAEDINENYLEISYPVLEVPEKIVSFSFDKESIIEETLMGIKGQYLIFENKVLNIRKHQGYFLECSF